MTYKRSKVDSSNYCPYCGHNFTMNRERYHASYVARTTHGGWAFALTRCRHCNKEFWFRNICTDIVRKYGLNPVMKLEERGKAWEELKK